MPETIRSHEQLHGQYHNHGVASVCAADQRAGMTRFFATELKTADWIRALSLDDAAANVSSFRPDHGVTSRRRWSHLHNHRPVDLIIDAPCETYKTAWE